MNSPTPLLRVQNLSKSYGDVLVFHDLSFDVASGHCLCIVGRSGIGKSVLTRVLTGLEEPDSGSLEYYGQNYACMPEWEWNGLRRKMGLVFQQSALLDSLTIRENLLLNLKAVSPFEATRRCLEVIAQVGLEAKVLDLNPAELSGGMRKRVAIARAIIHQPEILFYDEPTAGLDPVNAHRIDQLMAKLHRTGCTTVIVTHDIETVKNIATHVLWLQDSCSYNMLTTDAFFRSSSDLLVRNLANFDLMTESVPQAHLSSQSVGLHTTTETV